VAGKALVNPVELPANQLHRFYRGGARIAAFRGLDSVDDDAPEDWLASTTVVHGDGGTGLSRLLDGTFLRDVIDADPETFLGPAHTERFGSDPAVLVKLLDAGERLPLHLHPAAAFAQQHLGSRWGKNEAWIILDALPGAMVHVGFSRELAEHELEQLVRDQALDRLVGAMQGIPVAAGDSIFVPAGTPHVIGEGIFLLELQEPSDLSLLLEWKPGGEEEAFLGLPRRLGLGAVGRGRTSAERLRQLRQNRGASYFPSEADEFFRADRIVGGSILEPSFSVVIVLEGEGTLEPAHADALPVSRGSTVLVPYAAGAVTVRGSVRGVACRPPAA
jgi:mannose-6-phosphate isomerase